MVQHPKFKLFLISDDDYDSSDDFSDDSSESDENNIEQEPHVHTSIFPEHNRPEHGLLKSSCEPLCVFINSEQAIMQPAVSPIYLSLTVNKLSCRTTTQQVSIHGAHAIYHSQFSFWQVACGKVRSYFHISCSSLCLQSMF